MAGHTRGYRPLEWEPEHHLARPDSAFVITVLCRPGAATLAPVDALLTLWEASSALSQEDGVPQQTILPVTGCGLPGGFAGPPHASWETQRGVVDIFRPLRTLF